MFGFPPIRDSNNRFTESAFHCTLLGFILSAGCSDVERRHQTVSTLLSLAFVVRAHKSVLDVHLQMITNQLNTLHIPNQLLPL
jgi:hypothetical protein